MWCLYIIMGVGAIDFADRAVLAVVFEDIKSEFGVSDTALGALVTAYTILAALSVIPCGILADRWRRTWLIAIGFAPWTLGMFLQGAATSFAMLFGGRLFLGSIEATNGPSSLSLIGDYYPVERRSRVMGIWRTFELLGSAIGFGVAGLIASSLGWRAAFFAFAALGPVCAVIVLRYLPEPERGLPDALYRAEHTPAPTDTPAPRIDFNDISLRDAAGWIARTRTAWVMVVGASVGLFVTTGIGAWATTFFRRDHDMDTAQAGGVAVLFGVGAILGIIAGSRAGDRLLAAGNARGRVVLAVAAYTVGFAIAFPAFATRNTPLAIVLLFLGAFAMSVPVAPLWAMWLDIIVPQLRGRADAFFAIVRVVAISTGPLVIGALSDAYNLRAAFLIVTPVLLLNVLVLLPARTWYPEDAARAQQDALSQATLERLSAA